MRRGNISNPSQFLREIDYQSFHLQQLETNDTMSRRRISARDFCQKVRDIRNLLDQLVKFARDNKQKNQHLQRDSSNNQMRQSYQKLRISCEKLRKECERKRQLSLKISDSGKEDGRESKKLSSELHFYRKEVEKLTFQQFESRKYQVRLEAQNHSLRQCVLEYKRKIKDNEKAYMIKITQLEAELLQKKEQGSRSLQQWGILEKKISDYEHELQKRTRDCKRLKAEVKEKEKIITTQGDIILQQKNLQERINKYWQQKDLVYEEIRRKNFFSQKELPAKEKAQMIFF